jgi:hypothetical protein
MANIRGSFYMPLPALNMRRPGDGGTWEIPPIKLLGSTDKFDAPKALEEVSSQMYCDVANAIIPRLLLTTYLPGVEGSIFLRTEGDVVHAVTLYLLHPVNMALGAMGGSIYCQSEVRQGPTAHTDVMWKWTNGTKTVTLGVLELKNTQLLVEGDIFQGVHQRCTQPGGPHVSRSKHESGVKTSEEIPSKSWD